MSRIRSQLDSILAGNQIQNSGSPAPMAPRRAYEPSQPQAYQPPAQKRDTPFVTARHEPLQSTAAPNHDLINLQRTLDQLAQRINNLPKPGTPAPTLQADDLKNSHSALVNEIRNGYQQLRQDLNETRSVADPDLGSDLKRIADGIAKLQRGQSVHPDYVDQMQAELGNLNAGLNQLINAPHSQVDLSGVSRSIETGYSDIVNKLDQVLSSRGNELPMVEQKDYSGQFASLGNRLEEITRAVVSLTVSPNNTQDQLSFERVEARLASLAKSVDAIIENDSSSQIPVQGMDPAIGESIAAQLAQLSEKLDNAGTMNEVGSHIFADVQGIASRLDNLQSEFGTLVSSLDRGDVIGQPSAGMNYSSHFGEIESRLSDLANRMDAIMEQPGTSPNTESQEVLSLLRDLVGRVEGIEQLALQSTEEDQGQDHFAGLEAQISAIAKQLGSLGNAGGGVTDFSSINERLDHIEGQIASSRDIVIDIASEAAERAAQASAGNGGNDAHYSAIMEELQHLREGQGSTNQGGLTDHQFGTITETMAMIADRLANLETSNAIAFENNSQFAYDNQAEVEPVANQYQNTAHQPDEAFRQPAVSMHDDDVYHDTQHDVYAAVEEQVRPVETADSFQQVDDAPSLDVHFGDKNEDPAHVAHDYVQPEVNAPEAEGEDVPLEPGSGMPDLEALVRRATQRKKSKNNEETNPVEEESSSSTSELMAAARRAAKMASQEASAMAAEQPAKKASKRPSISSFKAPVFVNKKMLMMTAAVAAIAIGGFVVVPKLLGSSKSVSVVEAPAVAGPSETVSEESLETAENIENSDTIETGTASSESQTEIRNVDDTVASDSRSAMLSSTPVAEQPSQAMASVEGDVETASPAPVTGISETLPQNIGNADLLAAAKAGDGNALFEVARRYTDGDGVERDLGEAVKWYKIAAEKGHAPSQYRLGNFYEKGHGIAADPVEAAIWYSKAAAQGNALAMHNLAVLNAMGAATGDVDMSTAIGWFDKAANMGVKDSQVNLGILYTTGRGVEEDLEQAYKWFAVAAKGGDNDAGKKRDTVAQAMRPEQLEKARGEAELWKPTKIDTNANVAQIRDEWKTGSSPKSAALSKSEIIKRTQMMLAKAGFDPGAPDGQMGSKTRSAIEAFQGKMGLPVDGQISEQLFNALTKVSI